MRDLAIAFLQFPEDCTGCGLCARLCPTAAISLVNGKPDVSPLCLACETCVEACPQGILGIMPPAWRTGGDGRGGGRR